MKELKAYYSKREQDHMVDWVDEENDSSYGGANANFLISHLFGTTYSLKRCGKEFLDELDRRGYDITTLKFSIKGKK